MEKVIYTIAFRIKDTTGILYRHEEDPIACIKYIQKVLKENGQVKGVAIETQPLDN